MNCVFCPTKEITPYWDGFGKHNRCERCCTYYQIVGAQIVQYHFNIQYQEEIYTASYYPIKNAAYKFFLSLAKTGPGAYIIRFKDIPKDITPYNLADKLPTILTFS